ncbi:MAG: hypothetical protein BMS9Abin25_0459 [Gammaproteobacteria bacterium]|nr:MAG: hypothetical protein BMS9Abin25_0459 [Gammaproteobacteria bacterium]
MKTLQLFSDKYLAQSRQASSEQILEYLESFRLMNSAQATSKLISIKVPQPLLDSFRRRCEFEGARYQTKIKTLMKDWLQGR